MVPDRRTPVVTHMLWYKVGSADEPPGTSGIAHFLEHLLFKGTVKNPAGKFSQGRGRDRRSGERIHLQRLHRLLPAHLARASQDADGIRGRPHDRPGADRRRREARTERRAGRAEPARRQQPERAARRAGRGRALSQSSLRPAGDRLAARDRDAQPRGRAGVLQALLHAQQRDPGGGGRRHRRRGEGDGGGDLRQGRPGRRDRSAQAPAGAGADRAAPGHARRPARRAAELAAILPRAVRRHRQARRIRGARGAVPHPRRRQHQPALPHAGGGARNGGQRRAAGIPAPRSTPPGIGHLRLAQARRSRCNSSKRRWTR